MTEILFTYNWVDIVSSVELNEEQLELTSIHWTKYIINKEELLNN